jgi:hypothetical protein
VPDIFCAGVRETEVRRESKTRSSSPVEGERRREGGRGRRRGVLA